MITVLRQLTLILKFIPCAQFIIQFLYQVQLIFFSFASELWRSSILSQLCLSFIRFSAQFHLIFVSSSSDFRLIFASQFFLICVLVASSNFHLMQVIRNPAKKSKRGEKTRQSRDKWKSKASGIFSLPCSPLYYCYSPLNNLKGRYLSN